MNQSLKNKQQKIDIETELTTGPLQKDTSVRTILTALSAQVQGLDIVVLLPSDHLI